MFPLFSVLKGDFYWYAQLAINQKSQFSYLALFINSLIAEKIEISHQAFFAYFVYEGQE